MVSIGNHVYVYWCKKVVYGNSNGSEVKVGTHQGSALSPLLFVTVMEALTREFRVALPWELLYADDLVVIAETEDDLIKMLKGGQCDIRPTVTFPDVVSANRNLSRT